MTIKCESFIKAVALLLVAAFTVTDLSYAAPVDAAKVLFPPSPLEVLLKDPTQFEIPAEFVSLKEIHRGANGTFIIHIQDAHSNLSGQENLAKALDRIMDKYKVSLVLVEGGTRDDTLTSIKPLASPAVWKKVAKQFLSEGKISGEEYLNLTSDHPMKIVGIEDKETYMQSLRAYADLAQKREDALSYISRIHSAADKLKTKLYSSDLLNYEKTRKKNKDENFEENLRGLLDLAAAQKVDLKEFPSLQKIDQFQRNEKQIDFKLANLEQAALADEIVKRGGEKELSLADFSSGEKYAYFRKTFRIAQEKHIDLSSYSNYLLYGKYVGEFADLELDSVFEELEKLEDEVYKRALDSEMKTGVISRAQPEKSQENTEISPATKLRRTRRSARNDRLLLRCIDRYLRLLNTAHRIQMSATDFASFKANEPDFSTANYLAYMNRQLAERNFFDDIVPYENFLENGKKSLGEFYDSVAQRDLSFVKNAEKILQNEKQSVAILISGGYHTSHLKQLFKERGISYAVLAPRVTSETDQKKYEKILLEPLQNESAAKVAQITVGKDSSTARPVPIDESYSEINKNNSRFNQLVLAAARLANTDEKVVARVVLEHRLKTADKLSPTIFSQVSKVPNLTMPAPTPAAGTPSNDRARLADSMLEVQSSKLKGERKEETLPRLDGGQAFVKFFEVFFGGKSRLDDGNVRLDGGNVRFDGLNFLRQGGDSRFNYGYFSFNILQPLRYLRNLGDLLLYILQALTKGVKPTTNVFEDHPELAVFGEFRSLGRFFWHEAILDNRLASIKQNSVSDQERLDSTEVSRTPNSLMSFLSSFFVSLSSWRVSLRSLETILTASSNRPTLSAVVRELISTISSLLELPWTSRSIFSRRFSIPLWLSAMVLTSLWIASNIVPNPVPVYTMALFPLAGFFPFTDGPLQNFWVKVSLSGFDDGQPEADKISDDVWGDGGRQLSRLEERLRSQWRLSNLPFHSSFLGFSVESAQIRPIIRNSIVALIKSALIRVDSIFPSTSPKISAIKKAWNKVKEVLETVSVLFVVQNVSNISYSIPQIFLHGNLQPSASAARLADIQTPTLVSSRVTRLLRSGSKNGTTSGGEALANPSSARLALSAGGRSKVESARLPDGQGSKNETSAGLAGGQAGSQTVERGTSVNAYGAAAPTSSRYKVLAQSRISLWKRISAWFHLSLSSFDSGWISIPSIMEPTNSAAIKIRPLIGRSSKNVVAMAAAPWILARSMIVLAINSLRLSPNIINCNLPYLIDDFNQSKNETSARLGGGQARLDSTEVSRAPNSSILTLSSLRVSLMSFLSSFLVSLSSWRVSLRSLETMLTASSSRPTLSAVVRVLSSTISSLLEFPWTSRSILSRRFSSPLWPSAIALTSLWTASKMAPTWVLVNPGLLISLAGFFPFIDGLLQNFGMKASLSDEFSSVNPKTSLAIQSATRLSHQRAETFWQTIQDDGAHESTKNFVKVAGYYYAWAERKAKFFVRLRGEPGLGENDPADKALFDSFLESLRIPAEAIANQRVIFIPDLTPKRDGVLRLQYYFHSILALHLIERALEVVRPSSDEGQTVVYDFGAGSGLLTLRSALDRRVKQVIAIEHDELQLGLLRQALAANGISFDEFPAEIGYRISEKKVVIYYGDANDFIQRSLQNDLAGFRPFPGARPIFISNMQRVDTLKLYDSLRPLLRDEKFIRDFQPMFVMAGFMEDLSRETGLTERFAESHIQPLVLQGMRGYGGAIQGYKIFDKAANEIYFGAIAGARLSLYGSIGDVLEEALFQLTRDAEELELPEGASFHGYLSVLEFMEKEISTVLRATNGTGLESDKAKISVLLSKIDDIAFERLGEVQSRSKGYSKNPHVQAFAKALKTLKNDLTEALSNESPHTHERANPIGDIDELLSENGQYSRLYSQFVALEQGRDYIQAWVDVEDTLSHFRVSKEPLTTERYSKLAEELWEVIIPQIRNLERRLVRESNPEAAEILTDLEKRLLSIIIYLRIGPAPEGEGGAIDYLRKAGDLIRETLDAFDKTFKHRSDKEKEGIRLSLEVADVILRRLRIHINHTRRGQVVSVAYIKRHTENLLKLLQNALDGLKKLVILLPIQSEIANSFRQQVIPENGYLEEAQKAVRRALEILERPSGIDVSGARLASVKEKPSRPEEQRGRLLAVHIRTADEILNRFPEHGPSRTSHIQALLTLLYGGSAEYFYYETKNGKRRWKSKRFDDLVGLKKILREDSQNDIPIGEIRIRAIAAIEKLKDEFGIRVEQKIRIPDSYSETGRPRFRFATLGEILSTDPEFQNPFLHTFLGDSSVAAGQRPMSRLERAFDFGVGHVIPFPQGTPEAVEEKAHREAMAYLRKFESHFEPDLAVRTAGGNEIHPFVIRVIHNTARGKPAKGGSRFVRASILTSDEEFMKKFNLLSKQVNEDELRYFLHKWLHEETEALAAGMTTKTAVANLPLGGAKGAVLFADVKKKDGKFTIEDFTEGMDEAQVVYFRADLLRRFVKMLYEAKRIGAKIDVPAPDAGSSAYDMDIMTDELIRQAYVGMGRRRLPKDLEDEFARIDSVYLKSPPGKAPVTKPLYLEAVARYLGKLRKMDTSIPLSLVEIINAVMAFTSKSLSAEQDSLGSYFRPEATGYGIVYVLKEVVKKDKGFIEQSRVLSFRDKLISLAKNPHLSIGDAGQDSELLDLLRRSSKTKEDWDTGLRDAGIRPNTLVSNVLENEDLSKLLDQLSLIDEKSPLKGMTAKIEGLGGVGYEAAKRLIWEGVRIRAIKEVSGTAFSAKQNGFSEEDVDRLAKLQRQEKGGFKNIGSAKWQADYPYFVSDTLMTSVDDFLSWETDIYLPSAKENSVTKNNVMKLRAKIIIEGANGAVTNEAFDVLLKEGKTIVIPDSLANAGGVIVSYFEMIQNEKNERWPEPVVIKLLEERLKAAVERLSEIRNWVSEVHSMSWRLAADGIYAKSALEARQLKSSARLAERGEIQNWHVREWIQKVAQDIGVVWRRIFVRPAVFFKIIRFAWFSPKESKIRINMPGLSPYYDTWIRKILFSRSERHYAVAVNTEDDYEYEIISYSARGERKNPEELKPLFDPGFDFISHLYPPIRFEPDMARYSRSENQIRRLQKMLLIDDKDQYKITFHEFHPINDHELLERIEALQLKDKEILTEAEIKELKEKEEVLELSVNAITNIAALFRNEKWFPEGAELIRSYLMIMGVYTETQLLLPTYQTKYQYGFLRNSLTRSLAYIPIRFFAKLDFKDRAQIDMAASVLRYSYEWHKLNETLIQQGKLSHEIKEALDRFDSKWEKKHGLLKLGAFLPRLLWTHLLDRIKTLFLTQNLYRDFRQFRHNAKKIGKIGDIIATGTDPAAWLRAREESVRRYSLTDYSQREIIGKLAQTADALSSRARALGESGMAIQINYWFHAFVSKLAGVDSAHLPTEQFAIFLRQLLRLGQYNEHLKSLYDLQRDILPLASSSKVVLEPEERAHLFDTFQNSNQLDWMYQLFSEQELAIGKKNNRALIRDIKRETFRLFDLAVKEISMPGDDGALPGPDQRAVIRESRPSEGEDSKDGARLSTTIGPNYIKKKNDAVLLGETTYFVYVTKVMNPRLHDGSDARVYIAKKAQLDKGILIEIERPLDEPAETTLNLVARFLRDNETNPNLDLTHRPSKKLSDFLQATLDMKEDEYVFDRHPKGVIYEQVRYFVDEFYSQIKDKILVGRAPTEAQEKIVQEELRQIVEESIKNAFESIEIRHLHEDGTIYRDVPMDKKPKQTGEVKIFLIPMDGHFVFQIVDDGAGVTEAISKLTKNEVSSREDIPAWTGEWFNRWNDAQSVIKNSHPGRFLEQSGQGQGLLMIENFSHHDLIQGTWTLENRMKKWDDKPGAVFTYTFSIHQSVEKKERANVVSKDGARLAKGETVGGRRELLYGALKKLRGHKELIELIFRFKDIPGIENLLLKIGLSRNMNHNQFSGFRTELRTAAYLEDRAKDLSVAALSLDYSLEGKPVQVDVLAKDQKGLLYLVEAKSSPSHSKLSQIYRGSQKRKQLKLRGRLVEKGYLMGPIMVFIETKSGRPRKKLSDEGIAVMVFKWREPSGPRPDTEELFSKLWKNVKDWASREPLTLEEFLKQNPPSQKPGDKGAQTIRGHVIDLAGALIERPTKLLHPAVFEAINEGQAAKASIRMKDELMRRIWDQIAQAEANGEELSISAPIRAVVFASGQDVFQTQRLLTLEHPQTLSDLPSLIAFPHENRTTLTLGLARDNDGRHLIDSIQYVNARLRVNRITKVPISLTAVNLKTPEGQADAVAYILGNVFGLRGIKVEVSEPSVALNSGGGFENSNIYDLLIGLTGQILSRYVGRDISTQELITLLIRAASNEFDDMTGGQGIHVAYLGANRFYYFGGILGPDGQSLAPSSLFAKPMDPKLPGWLNARTLVFQPGQHYENAVPEERRDYTSRMMIDVSGIQNEDVQQRAKEKIDRMRSLASEFDEALTGRDVEKLKRAVDEYTDIRVWFQVEWLKLAQKESDSFYEIRKQDPFLNSLTPFGLENSRAPSAQDAPYLGGHYRALHKIRETHHLAVMPLGKGSFGSNWILLGEIEDIERFKAGENGGELTDAAVNEKIINEKSFEITGWMPPQIANASDGKPLIHLSADLKTRFHVDESILRLPENDFYIGEAMFNKKYPVHNMAELAPLTPEQLRSVDEAEVVLRGAFRKAGVEWDPMNRIYLEEMLRQRMTSLSRLVPGRPIRLASEGGTFHLLAQADDDFIRKQYGQISIEEILNDSRYQNAARQTTVEYWDALGGHGSRSGRREMLARRLGKPLHDVRLGTKGTDVGIDVSLTVPGQMRPVRLFISVFELQLRALLYRIENQDFAAVHLRPLVNLESLNSVNDQLAKPFWDLENPALPGQTYAQKLQSHSNIQVLSPLVQAKLPGRDIQTNQVASEPGKPLAAGGTGYWFFKMVDELLKTAAPAQSEVWVFLSGENAAAPIPALVGYSVENNIPVIQVNTTNTAFDREAGRAGWIEYDGHVVPDIIEPKDIARLSSATTIYQAGQPGGIGRLGAQAQGTNMYYVNRRVMGAILEELRKALGKENERILYDIITPDFILNRAEEGAEPIDGAFSSSVHRLNRYLTIDFQSDPRLTSIQKTAIGKILPDLGLTRLLYFVNIPTELRTQWYYTVKNTFSSYLLGTDRLVYDRTGRRLTDGGSSAVLPSAVFSSPDPKFYEDEYRLYSVLGRANLKDAVFININGSFILTDRGIPEQETVPYDGETGVFVSDKVFLRTDEEPKTDVVFKKRVELVDLRRGSVAIVPPNERAVFFAPLNLRSDKMTQQILKLGMPGIHFDSGSLVLENVRVESRIGADSSGKRYIKLSAEALPPAGARIAEARETAVLQFPMHLAPSGNIPDKYYTLNLNKLEHLRITYRVVGKPDKGEYEFTPLGLLANATSLTPDQPGIEIIVRSDKLEQEIVERIALFLRGVFSFYREDLNGQPLDASVDLIKEQQDQFLKDMKVLGFDVKALSAVKGARLAEMTFDEFVEAVDLGQLPEDRMIQITRTDVRVTGPILFKRLNKQSGNLVYQDDKQIRVIHKTEIQSISFVSGARMSGAKPSSVISSPSTSLRINSVRNLKTGISQSSESGLLRNDKKSSSAARLADSSKKRSSGLSLPDRVLIAMLSFGRGSQVTRASIKEALRSLPGAKPVTDKALSKVLYVLSVGKEPALNKFGGQSNTLYQLPFGSARDQAIRLKEAMGATGARLAERNGLLAQGVQRGKPAGLGGLKQSGADIRTDKDGMGILQTEGRSQNDRVSRGQMIAQDKFIGLEKPVPADFHDSDAFGVEVVVKQIKQLLEIVAGQFLLLKMSVYGFYDFAYGNGTNNDRIRFFGKNFIHNLSAYFLAVALNKSAGIKEIKHAFGRLFFVADAGDGVSQGALDFRKQPASLGERNDFFGKKRSGDIFVPGNKRQSSFSQIFDRHVIFDNRHFNKPLTKGYHPTSNVSRGYQNQTTLSAARLALKEVRNRKSKAGSLEIMRKLARLDSVEAFGDLLNIFLGSERRKGYFNQPDVFFDFLKLIHFFGNFGNFSLNVGQSLAEMAKAASHVLKKDIESFLGRRFRTSWFGRFTDHAGKLSQPTLEVKGPESAKPPVAARLADTARAFSFDGENGALHQQYWAMAHPDDQREILALLAQNKKEDGDNRSYIYDLKHPFIFNGLKIPQVQIKGFYVSEDEEPVEHQGSGRAVVDLFGPHEISPQGGITAENAKNEYQASVEFYRTFDAEQGVFVKAPLGWGTFTGIYYRGKALGFVIMGVPEFMTERLTVHKIISDDPYGIFEGGGFGLQVLHEKRIGHGFLHLMNISTGISSTEDSSGRRYLVGIHDLDNAFNLMENAKVYGIEPSRVIAVDIFFSLLKISEDTNRINSTIPGQIDRSGAITSFLLGYFSFIGNSKKEETLARSFIKIYNGFDDFIFQIQPFGPDDRLEEALLPLYEKFIKTTKYSRLVLGLEKNIASEMKLEVHAARLADSGKKRSTRLFLPDRVLIAMLLFGRGSQVTSASIKKALRSLPGAKPVTDKALRIRIRGQIRGQISSWLHVWLSWLYRLDMVSSITEHVVKKRFDPLFPLFDPLFPLFTIPSGTEDRLERNRVAFGKLVGRVIDEYQSLVRKGFFVNDISIGTMGQKPSSKRSSRGFIERGNFDQQPLVAEPLTYLADRLNRGHANTPTKMYTTSNDQSRGARLAGEGRKTLAQFDDGQTPTNVFSSVNQKAQTTQSAARLAGSGKETDLLNIIQNHLPGLRERYADWILGSRRTFEEKEKLIRYLTDKKTGDKALFNGYQIALIIKSPLDMEILFEKLNDLLSIKDSHGNLILTPFSIAWVLYARRGESIPEKFLKRALDRFVFGFREEDVFTVDAKGLKHRQTITARDREASPEDVSTFKELEGLILEYLNSRLNEDEELLKEVFLSALYSLAGEEPSLSREQVVERLAGEAGTTVDKINQTLSGLQAYLTEKDYDPAGARLSGAKPSPVISNSSISLRINSARNLRTGISQSSTGLLRNDNESSSRFTQLYNAPGFDHEPLLDLKLLHDGEFKLLKRLAAAEFEAKEKPAPYLLENFTALLDFKNLKGIQTATLYRWSEGEGRLLAIGKHEFAAAEIEEGRAANQAYDQASKDQLHAMAKSVAFSDSAQALKVISDEEVKARSVERSVNQLISQKAVVLDKTKVVFKIVNLDTVLKGKPEAYIQAYTAKFEAMRAAKDANGRQLHRFHFLSQDAGLLKQFHSDSLPLAEGVKFMYLSSFAEGEEQKDIYDEMRDGDLLLADQIQTLQNLGVGFIPIGSEQGMLPLAGAVRFTDFVAQIDFSNSNFLGTSESLRQLMANLMGPGTEKALFSRDALEALQTFSKAYKHYQQLAIRPVPIDYKALGAYLRMITQVGVAA